MKTVYRLVLFVVVIFGIIIIYNLYEKGGENLPKSFDYGRIENNVYINDFFEIQVELPGSWVVLSQQEINAMNKSGQSLYSSDKNKADSAFSGADADIANLLSLYRYPTDSKKSNYSFKIVAQINRDPSIKNGKDVLFLLKKFLEGAQVKFEFDKEIYKHKFGNTNFYVLESKMLMARNELQQEYWAGILKGFSLSIILSYNNEEQKKELHDIIEKIKFKT